MELMKLLNDLEAKCAKEQIGRTLSAGGISPYDIDDLTYALLGYAHTGLDLGFVTGYRGEEDGDRHISFVCRVDNHFFHVEGKYDSWADDFYNWESAKYLGDDLMFDYEVKTKTYEVKRIVLRNKEGVAVFKNRELNNLPDEDV